MIFSAFLSKDGNTHRGAMSIWLMKTPEELIPAVAVESVRKVTVRMWLQPAKLTAMRKAAGSNIPAERGGGC